MININRPATEPPELTHQQGLKSGYYATEPIRRVIAETFHYKCYLCEKDSTNFNIEHLRSHQNDWNKKFDWRNLFYCCRNCNSIKSTSHDDILDCCDYSIIITDELYYQVYSDSESIIVDISSTNTHGSIQNTIKLMNLCFSGTTFDTETVAYETKRNLLDEMHKLKGLVHDYIQYVKTNQKARALLKLKEIGIDLDVTSPFIAFKISYIKNHRWCNEHFASLLPVFRLD